MNSLPAARGSQEAGFTQPDPPYSLSLYCVVLLYVCFQAFSKQAMLPSEGRVQIVGRDGGLGGPLPHNVAGVREATDEVR